MAWISSTEVSSCRTHSGHRSRGGRHSPAKHSEATHPRWPIIASGSTRPIRSTSSRREGGAGKNSTLPSHAASPAFMPVPNVRILILKLGALGDVVRTSYILPGLHERFGHGTHVTWITAPAALPILRFNPYVTELISIDR